MFPNFKKDECNVLFGSCKIPSEQIIPFLKAKKSCCDLKLEIEQTFSSKDKDNNFEATVNLSSRYFKAFIMKYPDGEMLISHCDPNENLIRKKIINLTCLFLRQSVGDYPTEHEKNCIINTMFTVFPSIQKQGQQLIKTYINNKLKNTRRNLNKLKKESTRNASQIKKAKQYLQMDEENKNISKKLYFLKNADPDLDRDRIYTLLKETLSHRLEESGSNNFSVFERYPIFRFDPKYVSAQIKTFKNIYIFFF